MHRTVYGSHLDFNRFVVHNTTSFTHTHTHTNTRAHAHQTLKKSKVWNEIFNLRYSATLPDMKPQAAKLWQETLHLTLSLFDYSTTTNFTMLQIVYLRAEVLTVMTMKNAIFRDVMSYGSCKMRHFGIMYCLHHLQLANEGRNITANSVPSSLILSL
jgi:hypothetical protein